MEKNQNPNLNYYLQKDVVDLITPESYAIEEGMKERHRLYSLLLMSITKFYWNGNKEGRDGEYPLNPTPKYGKDGKYGKYEFSDYIGHNIASIAVDAYGEIIDFEFNHNKLFNSSAEHAESRMVKRVYALTQINDSWKVSLDPPKVKDDYNTFEDVTMYTTLESCSQCSGIMALARVKEIVYLQTDPGMYLIGNILRNLTRVIPGVVDSTGALIAPMPITGADIDFQYFAKLNEAYAQFPSLLKTKPFFISKDSPPKEKRTPSVTSFLCTKSAFDIFKDAESEFDALSLSSIKYPDFKPSKNGKIVDNARTNLNVLEEVRDFYRYATESGKRGTPHK